MYAITGATGQVGGAVIAALLAQEIAVRAVVRRDDAATALAAIGCDTAVAHNLDIDAMVAAFTGVEGVFVLMPPNYDPEPGFPQTVAANAAIVEALNRARPPKVVVLSTVGAHVGRDNLLVNLKMTEEALSGLEMPVTFLRAAWFIENALWDLPGARNGRINMFLQPVDHPIPVIAVSDIGAEAARLLRSDWQGSQVVELEAERRYSGSDFAEAFSAALGHPVEMNTVPRAEWETLFRAGGARHPLPRIQMLDGFNEGWIDFEGGPGTQRRTGSTTLLQAITAMIQSHTA